MKRAMFIGLLAFVFSTSPAVGGQLASRAAEEWNKTLESSDRVTGLKIDEIVSHLNLKPGTVVADIGAGPGLFEVQLAKAVSPGGKVYAVEVDSGFFASIRAKTEAARVGNVETVLGQFTDPSLPTKDIDLAFFHDVLHHIQDRPGYLKSLAAYLKPSARIAIIDFERGQGGHKDAPDLQVTREQLATWMTALGFKQSDDFKLFAEKYFLVYSR